MAGQAHHFRNYAPEKVQYGIDRYTNEVNRLCGVLNKRLADRDYLAGDYSIADMAAFPWARLWKNQGQDIAQFPDMAGWLERCLARPAVARGLQVGREYAKQLDLGAIRKRRPSCSARKRVRLQGKQSPSLNGKGPQLSGPINRCRSSGKRRDVS